MSILSELRPTTMQRVMDLVAAAGLDVSAWGDFKGGPEKAASNPKFCYEWAYVEPDKPVVVNIWHDALAEEDGTVVLRDNKRRQADRYEAELPGQRLEEARPGLGQGGPVRLPRGSSGQGDRGRSEGEANAGPTPKASKVDARLLDPVPWAVTQYDPGEGAFTLVRGAEPVGLEDQFDVAIEPDSPVERRDSQGKVFVRDAQVREEALARAGGRCELCGALGFMTDRGTRFLETHHIVPLGEGGPDSSGNVAVLCPNHHREAHHGLRAGEIRGTLLDQLSQRLAKGAS